MRYWQQEGVGHGAEGAAIAGERMRNRQKTNLEHDGGKIQHPVICVNGHPLNSFKTALKPRENGHHARLHNINNAADALCQLHIGTTDTFSAESRESRVIDHTATIPPIDNEYGK